MKNNSIYYDYSALLSHKAHLNFVVGPRGNGKTYGAKKLVLRKFFKNREQFVYMRRTQEATDQAKTKFLTDIILAFEKEMENAEMYVVGDTMYYREEGEEPEIVGYFIPLSVYEKYKSSSYHYVTTILYDEFLSKERYLKDEVWKFNDLYETIFRDRLNARAILIANSLSANNPYFEAFNIKPNGKGIVRQSFKVDGGELKISCDFCESKEYIEHKKTTPAGLLAQATGYAAYSMDAEFVLDDNRNVFSKISGVYDFRYNMRINERVIGVYMGEGCYWFSHPMKDGKTYCFTAEEAAKYGNQVIDLKWHNFKTWSKLFKTDRFLYNSLTIKNEIVTLMRNIIRKY